MQLAKLEPSDVHSEMRVACWNSNGHFVSEDASTIVEPDCRLTQRAANYHFKAMRRVIKGFQSLE